MNDTFLECPSSNGSVQGHESVNNMGQKPLFQNTTNSVLRVYPPRDKLCRQDPNSTLLAISLDCGDHQRASVTTQFDELVGDWLDEFQRSNPQGA